MPLAFMCARHLCRLHTGQLEQYPMCERGQGGHRCAGWRVLLRALGVSFE